MTAEEMVAVAAAGLAAPVLRTAIVVLGLVAIGVLVSR